MLFLLGFFFFFNYFNDKAFIWHYVDIRRFPSKTTIESDILSSKKKCFFFAYRMMFEK